MSFFPTILAKNRNSVSQWWLMICPVLSLQTIAPSSALKSYELLHRITGEGLSVEYCFSRQPFSPDANMVAVQMQFTNNATSDTKNLHMEDVKQQSGMRVKEFPEIGELRKSNWVFLLWRDPNKITNICVIVINKCRSLPVGPWGCRAHWTSQYASLLLPFNSFFSSTMMSCS